MAWKKRSSYLAAIASDFEVVPIVALLGPRQCGKTTLAKQFAAEQQCEIHYFDLEDYTDLAKLENPKLTFSALKGLVIIDEIQRKPDLFPYLRVVVDTMPLKFLISGSASPDLIRQSTESLAGRIAYIEVTPFSLQEVGDQNQLWVRGGFPRSYLAENDQQSSRWREVYMQSYFERDLPSFGMTLPPHRVLRFWSMLAHYHAKVVNYHQMAQFNDISVSTLKDYLAILEGTFLLRTLMPWHDNGGKRLVKSPKIYIRDAGLFHQLVRLKSYQELILSPHRGPSFEGFALEEVTKALHLRASACSFWATHQEAELDLFAEVSGKRIGFEFKCTDQPKMTKSMASAKANLHLDHLYIITPIEASFALDEEVSVLALKDVPGIM